MTRTWQSVRESIPGLRSVTYLNSASNGLLPPEVPDAVYAILKLRNEARDTREFEVLEVARERLAGLLNTSLDNVALTPSTNDGLNIAARTLDWHEGDNVLLGANEFPAVYYAFYPLIEKGVDVRVIEHEGYLTPDVFEAASDSRTRAIAVSAVSFHTGWRAPLADLGRLCRSHGWRFIVDGIQAVGTVPVDVEAAQVDFLAGAGNKWLMSPQGVGYLYVRPEVAIGSPVPSRGWHGNRNFMSGLTRYRDDPWPNARRFETGTINIPGYRGLCAAIDILNEVGLDNVHRRNQQLGLYLRTVIRRFPVKILAEPRNEHERSSVCSFIPQGDPEKLYQALHDHDVIVSLRDGAIRVAPHFYNTEADIDRFANVLESLIG